MIHLLADVLVPLLDLSCSLRHSLAVVVVVAFPEPGGSTLSFFSAPAL
jgi:hypothetical protein